MKKLQAWSFSALTSFETCPKRHWHLKVQKDVREPEGEALKYGKRVHKCLERLVRDRSPLPKEFKHMQPYVQKFIDSPATKLCELEMAITDKYTPTTWFAPDVWVRAKLDLVLMGNASALVIDYKTGKKKDDGFDQLKLAAVMLMLHYKQLQSVKLGYLWTEHSGGITQAEVIREDFLPIWNTLLPRQARFQSAYDTSEFPAQPSGLCKRHCPVHDCIHNGGN